MLDNMGRIWSFLDSDTVQEIGHDDVAEHGGLEVDRFGQLTDYVAQLNFYNPNLNLYFRGQTKDHQIRRRGEKEKSALLPGAFRKPISRDEASSGEYLTRTLRKMDEALMKELETLPSWRSKRHRQLTKRIGDFRERRWAILQHYDCPTPLLDVTQSLEVACWMATHEYPTGTPSSEGYIYVLGLPSIQGHITFFPYEGIVMLKLASACPPEAKRPHCQEGYLVGSTPHSPQAYTYRYRDVALRLVAKFHIAAAQEFWEGVGNTRVSKATLFPEDDDLKRIVREIRDEYL